METRFTQKSKDRIEAIVCPVHGKTKISIIDDQIKFDTCCDEFTELVTKVATEAITDDAIGDIFK